MPPMGSGWGGGRTKKERKEGKKEKKKKKITQKVEERVCRGRAGGALQDTYVCTDS